MSIKETLIRSASRSLLQVRKYSPEILTGIGIAGGVASAIMGAKATLHVEPIVDDTKAHLENAKTRHELDKDSLEYKREVAYIYTKAGIKLARLYGPAVSLGLASVGCILSAHGIMKKRNAALVASYKVLESAFSEYRERVAEAVGEDREKELYFNLEDKEVETDKGPQVIKQEKEAPGALSEYAKCFDQLNPNWQGNPEYNLYFLRAQQNYANDMLRVRGHVFLNDVYDQLGIPRTKAGAVVGWVKDGNGDGYIDFGIYDVNRPMALEFVNGHESAIWLDFNVDGVIYDLI